MTIQLPFSDGHGLPWSVMDGNLSIKSDTESSSVFIVRSTLSKPGVVSGGLQLSP